MYSLNIVPRYGIEVHERCYIPTKFMSVWVTH